MKNISKTRKNVVIAYNRGFRVEKDGNVIGVRGKPLSLYKKGTSPKYYFFSIRNNGERLLIAVHVLCAYQKFGEKALTCECVRHLDGNSLNNSYNNIAIGTFSDNTMDIPKEIRKKSATIASHSFIMKWNEDDVKKIKDFYNTCHSYKETMIKFKISSKGTLFNILHNR